jgi:3-oxoacyl-[acyl-carrier-protein] synthase III
MSESRVQSGQSACFTGVSIAGIVACVPPRIVDNAEFEKAFGTGVGDVTKMTGVEHRRWVADDITTSDLCVAASMRLLGQLDWGPDTVDALIFISQTPDYRLPATACVMQAKLGLRKGIIAFDVNLGCSAYPYGLWLASMLVASGSAKRVLLAVGDTSSRVVDPQDRATAMLFGDAGAVTAVAQSSDSLQSHFILGSDGSGYQNLIIREGASRGEQISGRPNPTKLFMDGGEIFNFTLKAVPPLIRDLMELSGFTTDDHDAFLFHQANTFMINHLAKKAKLPTDKVPINIGRYGNTSSATIPLLMADDLADRLLTKDTRLAMFGFGVGYSWAAASIPTQPFACAEVITL